MTNKTDDSLGALAGIDTSCPKPMAQWADIAGVVMVSFCVLWLAVAALSAMWLAYQVPLTGDDLVSASWLPSYTTATHFSGFMAWAMGATMLLMGLGVGLAKQSILPVISTVLMLVGISLNSEGLMVRIGIATDTVKIGCFVYETTECRVMLGLPAGKTQSRYGADGLDAGWYQAAREKAITANPSDIALQSVPGWAFLQAPFYVTDTESIKQKVAQQRAALAQFKANN